MSKKNYIFFFLVLTCCSLFVALRAQTVTFQKTYGGVDAYEVQQTTDGGFISSGYTTDIYGKTDVYLVKTDANGNALWEKSFGGTKDEEGYSVRQTIDGGYIITSSTNSFSGGLSDIYLIKTDSNGNMLWTKTFGGTGVDAGYSVQQSSDAGYIIAGESGGHACLIKTNSGGNMLWVKSFAGIYSDQSYSVEQVIDGGFIFSGDSYNAGMNGAFLIKTDSIGTMLWSKIFGDTTANGFEYYNSSVRQTKDKGFVISGYTSDIHGNENTYLIKTDSSGNMLWSKTYGGTIGNGGNSVQQTIDRGFIISGFISGSSGNNEDTYLIKTDSIGNMLWSKSFGETGIDDGGYFVLQTPDEGYILASRSAAGVRLIKTDSLGSSGCNEYTPLTIQTNLVTIQDTPTFVIGNPALQTSSPPTVTTTPATVETTLCSTASVNELQVAGSMFQIYPNPTSGKFQITTNEFQITNMEIYNVFGERIYKLTNHFINQSTVFDLSSYPNGIYFVQIISCKGKAVNKIIIQK